MILLIGATGQTGSEIARELNASGVKARALVRNLQKAETLRNLGFELAPGDAEDSDSLDRALEGVQTLIVSTSPDPRLPEIQEKIFDAARRAGVRRVIKISAAGADPNASFRFARIHGQSDEDLMNSGVPFTILRPHFFMQNFLAFAQQIRQGRLVMPLGEGRIAAIDTADIAAVAVLVSSAPGHENRIYELSGPEALPGREFAAKFSQVLGKHVEFIDPDPEQFRQAMIGFGMPEWLAGGVVELYEVFRQGYAADTTGEVERLTGVSPIRFEQFVARYGAVFA